jgi:hypothetical protein
MFADHFEIQHYGSGRLYCIIFRDSDKEEAIFMNEDTFDLFASHVVVHSDERGFAAAVPTIMEGQMNIDDVLAEGDVSGPEE